MLIHAALELLLRYLEDCPDNLQLPWTCQQIADCFEKLGKVPEAILAYERTFEAQKKYPMYVSHVEILLARFVIANSLVNLYKKMY